MKDYGHSSASDKSHALAITGIIAGAVVVMTLIGVIFLSAQASSNRLQEYRLTCMEQGGTVVSVGGLDLQCQRITTIDIKESK